MTHKRSIIIRKHLQLNRKENSGKPREMQIKSNDDYKRDERRIR